MSRKKANTEKQPAEQPEAYPYNAPAKFGGNKRPRTETADAGTGKDSRAGGTEAPEEFGGMPSGSENTATAAGNKVRSESGGKEPHIVLKLFRSFFKIGVFTFGGGYAMIPLIQREVTDKRKWVDAERFLELLTLAQSAPGPISLNTAVFVGYNLAGYGGAAAAILGTILPSFVIILLIAMYFTDIKDNHAVEAVFKGMRPAVVALIVAPLFGFTKGMGPYRIGMAVLVAAAIWKLGVSPAWFILIGAVGGILWAYNRKRKEARK